MNHGGDCEKTSKQLFAYLDRELSAREVAEIEAHLRKCGKCEDAHAAERRLIEALRNAPCGAPDTALRARVLAALQAAREGERDADTAGGP